jgi:hypothetical protein
MNEQELKSDMVALSETMLIILIEKATEMGVVLPTGSELMLLLDKAQLECEPSKELLERVNGMPMKEKSIQVGIWGSRMCNLVLGYLEQGATPLDPVKMIVDKFLDTVLDNILRKLSYKMLAQLTPLCSTKEAERVIMLHIRYAQNPSSDEVLSTCIRMTVSKEPKEKVVAYLENWSSGLVDQVFQQLKAEYDKA